jgi:mono/diheme cytochrome c family protein
MTVSRQIRYLLLGALVAGCSPTPDDGGGTEEETRLTFPWDAENNGKEDAFGRSLIGVPDAYVPDEEILADQEAADANLRSNMKLRRQIAWETAFKTLEPVPLLGLANQVDALPDCPEGVETNDIDKCERQDSEEACVGFESGGANICAWDDEGEACAPTCDNLRLPDGQEIPKIPRFSTWYGVEDVNRIFQNAYLLLEDDEKRARRSLTDAEIGEAMQLNNTAVERSSRWPLRRYTSKVDDLFGCDLEQQDGETEEEFAERCAQSRQSQFSGGSSPGGGIARMVYSPAMVLHMMRNYAEILACRDDQLADTWCGEDEPCADPPDNFSTCFKSEFPADAGNPWAELDPEEVGTVAGLPDAGGTVLIKATWQRVGFGFDLPAYDTDAEALEELIGDDGLALWGEEGDRTYGPDDDFPTADDIYTIETRSGGKYRLTGLHIVTKELRHWQWISLWWSDKPDTDFGADRPESFQELPGVWSNYKMCAVVDYEESDQEMLQRFEELPTLQDALEVTGSEPGAPTWCSNPYIEEGAGNARTNCIGCHQHAGTRVAEDGSDFDLEAIIDEESLELDATNRYPANGRLRRRTHFATDYSWAFSRMDDLTELIRTEVEFHGAQDEEWRRMRDILLAEGDVDAGEEVFRNATESQTCTDCHGENGEGGFGPSFEQRFVQKTDWQLLNTVINGRGSMPAWGDELTDEQLTDLFAYLEANFAPQQ